MPATVYVVARFVAKAGHEAALKSVLIGLVPPTRRELGCYQYDMLVNPSDARELCFVERWDGGKAFDQHLETQHVKSALAQAESHLEMPPEIHRYQLV